MRFEVEGNLELLLLQIIADLNLLVFAARAIERQFYRHIKNGCPGIGGLRLRNSELLGLLGGVVARFDPIIGMARHKYPLAEEPIDLLTGRCPDGIDEIGCIRALRGMCDQIVMQRPKQPLLLGRGMRHGFPAIDHVTQHIQHICAFRVRGRVEHVERIAIVAAGGTRCGLPPAPLAGSHCKSRSDRHRSLRDAVCRAPRGTSQNPH